MLMFAQTLVNILLRPHLTDEDAAMLSTTSHIRVQVEDARADLIRYIRKRWMGMHQQGGFDGLEGSVIKEISRGMLLCACAILPSDARAPFFCKKKKKSWGFQLMTSYHPLSHPTPGALPSENLLQPQMQSLIQVRLCNIWRSLC
jgi:hypothetical protein